MKKNLNIAYLNGAEGIIRKNQSGSGSGESDDKEENVGAAILALSTNFRIGNAFMASDIYIDLLKMKVIPNTFNTGIVTKIEKLDTVLETPFGKTNNFYDIIINVDWEQVSTFRIYGMNFCLTSGFNYEIETFVVKKDNFSYISHTSSFDVSSGQIYVYQDIDVNSIYFLIGKVIQGVFLIDVIRITSPIKEIEE